MTAPPSRMKSCLLQHWQTLLRWVLMLCVLSGAAPAAAQQAIRVGVYNFSPLVFIDEQKQVKGLFVDVLEIVAKQEGWKLDYVPGSWQETLGRLENGEIDLLMSIAASDERLKKFDFTRQHLFLDWGIVYRPKGSTIETIFDLKGKRIGVLKGSIYTTEFRKLMDQFGIPATFVEKAEYAEIFRSLGAGELDAGINANVSGSRMAEAHSVERTTILFAPIKLRFAVKKGANGELLQQLDRHFQALYADKGSVYYELHRKWMGMEGRAGFLPAWVLWALAGLVGVVGVLFGLNLLLKTQVSRKTAELAGTKNYYEQILAASPIGIITYDATGQCLTSNAQAAAVLDAPQEQILRQNFRQLESWRQSGLLEHAEAALAAGGTRHSEMHLQTAAGKDVWIDAIFGRFVADGQNHLVHLVADVSERKRAEAQIRQAAEEIRRINASLEQRVKERTAQLENANIMLAASTEDLARSNTELEQFAYVASHDLQEPLRMVVGFVQLLEKRLAGKLDAEALEFMGFAVDGALRMQRLIQDILSYSRVSSRGESLARVDSAAVVQETLALLDNQIAQSGARIEVSPLPRVVADRTQLAQLFQNLIGNALKFHAADAPKVRVEAAREGEQWRFTVADNGIGIAPEYAERIFGIFQRLHTRNEYEGTGIGLAICKRIVQRHGGEIGVVPAPGGGSAFWFTLSEEETLT